MIRTATPAAEREAEEQADRLIARYIEPYPGNPTLAESRLIVEEGGVPVWAIIGSLGEDGSNMDAVAHDYRVSRAAIEAAWAFYRRHRAAIDARLEANNW